VDGILKLKLSEVLVLGKEQFFHPHEFEAVEELAARVREQQQEKSTIAAGNWVDIYNTRRTVAGSATISLAK
jgi:predicted N-acetyltransferase YhbS